MTHPEESVTEILVRLRPALTAIFASFRVPEEDARKILKDSCDLLIVKRHLRYPDPERSLMRMVLDKCWRLRRKEAAVEDPPE
jgi:hypothetical protein